MTFPAVGARIISEVKGKGLAFADHASGDAKFHLLLRDLNEVSSKAGLGKLMLDWFSEYCLPCQCEGSFKMHGSRGFVITGRHRMSAGCRVIVVR